MPLYPNEMVPLHMVPLQIDLAIGGRRYVLVRSARPVVREPAFGDTSVRHRRQVAAAALVTTTAPPRNTETGPSSLTTTTVAVGWSWL